MWSTSRYTYGFESSRRKLSFVALFFCPYTAKTAKRIAEQMPVVLTIPVDLIQSPELARRQFHAAALPAQRCHQRQHQRHNHHRPQ